MAFTQSDLDAINTAIATGESEVEFADGRRVRYRSVGALKEARALVAGELAKASGKRPPRQLRSKVSKGI